VTELIGDAGSSCAGCGSIASKAAHGLSDDDAGISGSGRGGVGLAKPANAFFMSASASSKERIRANERNRAKGGSGAQPR